MKIDTIELSWFRGAATKATLKTGLKSVVVYGENACGKSSFVDAIEFIITQGKIEHLKNEFSDRNNCVRNTETPDGEDCKARIYFENGGYIEAHVPQTDRIRFEASSDDLLTAIQEWDVQRHILRQGEVSDFIHLTKSKKYSVLSPLLGLQEYEEIAQNMVRIRDSVLETSQYQMLQGEFVTIRDEINEVLPNVDAETRKKLVHSRAKKYVQVPIEETVDTIAKTAITALETLLQDKEPQVKRYLVMQSLNKIPIKKKLESVIRSQDELAKISENYIDHKIPILENTEKILESVEDLTQEIECPACGQYILGTEFKDHVNQELGKLKKVREARNQAVAEKQAFTVALSNFISQYQSEKAFLEWLSLPENKGINSLFVRLTEISIEEPTNRWSTELIEKLKVVTNELCPMVKKEARIEAPTTTTIVDGLNFFRVCLKIPRLEHLESTLAKIDLLLSTLNDSYNKIREEIANITEQVLKAISQDIAGIWSLIHPGQPIENVRLSPSEKDKAIEVCLKFYGKEQPDPRLTLSEGYRNSLGLSIFLALANQGNAKENPIVLDDIVSSLDREHRGKVTQLLSSGLAGRQVILFTHDREWFGELRGFLEPENWKFFTLKKWESPQIGIEVLPSSYTFDEAEALISTHIGSCGNAVRAIMDTELPRAAAKLKLAMPYMQGYHNDYRMATEFLDYFISQGERFRIKDVTGWKVHQDAIDAWKGARSLLIAWANRASHGGSLSTSEAKTLIGACKKALSYFDCVQCKKKVWALEAPNYAQCQCGSIRWKLE
jgi:energy-coupling factor transporter ATP-binding protein EcfA2/DNA-directed RNA polymerase subunit RPC12/RpoP